MNPRLQRPARYARITPDIAGRVRLCPFELALRAGSSLSGIFDGRSGRRFPGREGGARSASFPVAARGRRGWPHGDGDRDREGVRSLSQGGERIKTRSDTLKGVSSVRGPAVRPIRIVRAPEVVSPGGSDRPGSRPSPTRGNQAGYRRGRRLLYGYLLAVFLLYFLILLLLVTSRYPGVRENFVAYGLFTAIASASAVSGYILTLGRAPVAFYTSDGQLVIRERFGGVRRFPIGPGLRVTVYRRIPMGAFSPEPTEAVRVQYGDRATREYLLANGTLEGLPELRGARTDG